MPEDKAGALINTISSIENDLGKVAKDQYHEERVSALVHEIDEYLDQGWSAANQWAVKAVDLLLNCRGGHGPTMATITQLVNAGLLKLTPHFNKTT